MAETLTLLSQQREAELRQAAEARELQQEQQAWVALTDEYHQEIRKAAEQVGLKAIATDLGVDVSTVSNWLSCAPGRGFPPPKLLLYLRKKVPALVAWENVNAGYLPPEKPDTMSEGEELRRLKAALAANPDTQRAIYDRAFGPGVRP